MPAHGHHGYVNCEIVSKYLHSRLNIHCNAGWTDGVRKRSCNELGHVVGYSHKASERSIPSDPKEAHFPHELLAEPIMWGWKKPDPKRRLLSWPNKDVFHPDWGGGAEDHVVPRQGKRTLEAMVQLVERFPTAFDATHIFTGKWTFDPAWSWRVERLGILDLVSKLPTPVLHDWADNDVMMDILYQSKFFFIVSGLSYSATPHLIAAGSMPIPEPVSHHTLVPNPPPIDLKNEITAQELYERLEAFMLDDAKYCDLIDFYQEKLIDHRPEVVAKQFLYIWEKHANHDI